MDVERSTKRSARWIPKLIKSGFKSIFRPQKYYKQADTMFRLPQNASKKKQQNKNVDDEFPTYRFVERRKDFCTVFMMSDEMAELLPNSKKYDMHKTAIYYAGMLRSV